MFSLICGLGESHKGFKKKGRDVAIVGKVYAQVYIYYGELFMIGRDGIFAGGDPFEIVRRWLDEAGKVEPSDPNAMALATVDDNGMPNSRIVLMKDVEDDGFTFFTNYNSAKGIEVDVAKKAAFVIHWKSLRRQIRVRGRIERIDAAVSDEYYASRALGSRIGAWASQQSQVLASRKTLMEAVTDAENKYGDNPPRPENWGGYKIIPSELEFWADGEFRLHDRFKWTRDRIENPWLVERLNP